jgi:hypothetical protein
MNYYTPDDIQLKRRSTRFVRRMFMMRQLGTFLCFLPILSVLMEMGKSLELCALLFTMRLSGPMPPSDWHCDRAIPRVLNVRI